MTSQFATIRDLANKVHWEGGVIGALEYGIDIEAVRGIDDPELVALWRKMSSLYAELRPAVQQVDRMLHAARRPTSG